MSTENNNDDRLKRPYQNKDNNPENNDDPHKKANTGDWEDERDDAGTDPDRYDPEKIKKDANDNSGGAGSTGSASTNS